MPAPTERRPNARCRAVVRHSSWLRRGHGLSEPVTTRDCADRRCRSQATPEAASPTAPAAAVAEPPASTPRTGHSERIANACDGEPAGPTTSAPGSGGNLESAGSTARLAPAGDLARGTAGRRSAATGSARITAAINAASQPTATGPAYGRTGEPATHRGGRSVRSRSGAWVQEPVPADRPKTLTRADGAATHGYSELDRLSSAAVRLPPRPHAHGEDGERAHRGRDRPRDRAAGATMAEATGRRACSVSGGTGHARRRLRICPPARGAGAAATTGS